LSTNVGAGCSCHPTGAHIISGPSVPSDPVRQAPVVRLSGVETAMGKACGVTR